MIACPHRLEFTPDPKIPNAGTFKLEREDHTLGNLLRMQLLEDDRVTFVGYKNPHPLEHHIVLRVHTVGSDKPRKVLEKALECLQDEFSIIASGLEQSGAEGAKPAPKSDDRKRESRME